MTPEEKFGTATFYMYLGLAGVPAAILAAWGFLSSASGSGYGGVFLACGALLIGYLGVLLVSGPAALYSSRLRQEDSKLDTRPASAARFAVLFTVVVPALIGLGYM